MSKGFLEQLKIRAHEVGFVAAGGCDIDSVRPELLEAMKNYERWCADGLNGEMTYLSRSGAIEMRREPQKLFSGAQSVFVVLERYDRRPHGFLDPRLGPRVARYIDGSDYHDGLKAKLQALLSRAKADRSAPQDLEWKICVDTSAVLERFWANACALGFLGKNTMLIHPTDGSYSFIGVALLNKRLEAISNPVKSRCGSCDRCQKACPTGALSSEGLDSRRCISYRTLEQKSLVTDELDAKRGTWIAGCDLCQEACPFNFKAQKNEPGSRHCLTWNELETESEAEYRKRTGESALSRIKFQRSRQNLEIARLNAESEAIK